MRFDIITIFPHIFDFYFNESIIERAQENKLITIKEGTTSIPKNKKFAIFETGIILKNQKPKSAELNFTSFSPWEKDTTKEPQISLSHSELLATTTSPRITGTILNSSLEDVSEVRITVFVFDKDENVIAASETFVDSLKSRTSQDFVFTWPRSFERDASVVTVMYRFP